MSGARSSDSGNALVEFALVMPIVIVLLVGMIDVARAANAYATLSSAAREGSHYAALHPTAAPSAITSAVRARVEPLDPASVSVEATYNDGSSFVSWPTSGIPASTPAATSIPARVRVSYPWRSITGLVSGFFSVAPSFSATSTADAVR